MNYSETWSGGPASRGWSRFPHWECKNGYASYRRLFHGVFIHIPLTVTLPSPLNTTVSVFKL